MTDSRTIFLMMALLFTRFALSTSVAATPLRLSDAESLAGWSRGATLTFDAREGQFAVMAPLAPGKANFLTLDYRATGVDLSKAEAIAFWWKVEGEGLRQFYLKVRNYPLAGGMEAVYRVWVPSMGPPPREWTRARIRLAEPLFDDWGERPNREARYVVFRTEAAKDADVRLFLDEVVAVPRLFEWEIGRPERAPDADGWDLSATVRNVTSKRIRLRVGVLDREERPMTLAPKDSKTMSFRLTVPADRWAALRPLTRLTFTLFAEVEGLPDSRQERDVVIMKPMELASHPRLLFSAEGIAALKERIATYDWARSRWESLRRRADDLLDEPVVLPPRGGNWWHWYASPETGAPLKTGKRIGEWEWEHIDPVTGKVYRGDPSDPSRDYDGVVISREHSRWGRAILELGIAYQVTGETRYAAKAREILLAYAERYRDYPLHTIRNEPKIGGGRVGPQTLDESTWLIPVAQGADLVWETLDEADREALAEKLFQPAAREVILPHRLGVHNIQCWKNSAVGLVGFLLGDQELIYEAIENPERGYRRQMADGVTPDGVWWEGAWGYHFYTLSALWSLTEAARNNGLDLYGESLKGMFDAPIRFAMPNLRLPAFNDSSEMSLEGRASIYELAYARYRDPAYLDLIATGSRRDDFALYFGTGEVSKREPKRWESVNYPNSGYAILARGEGRAATWLTLKYGPHGGGHGHPDKLNFVLYARGEVIGVDPGTARYGQPIQAGWYRTTIAHNTLVVDEETQTPATGALLAFGSEGGVDFVTAEAGPIYEGVRFVRTAVLLGDDAVLFLDRVQAEGEHTFDIAYHQRGEWANRPEGRPWEAPETPGYRYFRDAEIVEADGFTATLRVSDELTTAVTLAATGPTEIITATGVGNHLEDRVPLVVFRRRGTDATLLWGIAFEGTPLRLEWDGARSIATATGADGRTWRLAFDEDGGVRVLP